MKNLRYVTMGVFTASTLLIGCQPVLESQVVQESTVLKQQSKTFQKINFEVGYTNPDFKVQGLNCTDIAFLGVSISGFGINPPIYADGSDSQNMIPNNCTTPPTISFSTIPNGNSRVVTVKGYDQARQELSGNVMKAVFNMPSSVETIQVSEQTNPVAQIVEELMAINGALAATIDIAALQTYVNNLLGISGTFPNFTFTTNPSLLNANLLAQALSTSQGNISSLSTDASAYSFPNNPVQLNINSPNGGAFGEDLRVVVGSFGQAIGRGSNSPANITFSNLAPGSIPFSVVKTSDGSSVGQGTATLNNQGSVSNNSVTLTGIVEGPVINNFSPATGDVETLVTINGLNLSNASVTFNGSPVSNITATATQVTFNIQGFGQTTAPFVVTTGNGSFTSAASYNFDDGEQCEGPCGPQ